ncbi:hypothetical protein RVR_P29 (plasmid) [Actinacidiphila reveromycinica]|uniref:MmyB-like transcription regulator ligand binding domain-containing protein n=1 Tax=Actinacidiphila reveromycinica TaxID=659352 RepID=A0A7R6QII3_9ACTN|nr:helix-turn-helix domain-containing protein [Streptomyces sp. SN-593]BBG20753.1 hypothetical protein RVR_P29 [Streptomyces sp. SN-593]
MSTGADRPAAQRADIGALLRAMRMKRDPALVPGLDAVRTRTRSYVTQLDMAMLLRCSERWYGALERGEQRDFSRLMLDGVVRVLDLAEDQAEMLYRVHGHTPPQPRVATPDPVLVQLVKDQTHCLSYLSDEAWDILACNTLAGLHCPWMTRPGANIMTWAFSADARYQMRDWETAWAVPILSELRSAWQRNPHNRRLAEVVATVRALPEVPALWARTTHVRLPYQAPRPMYLPLVSTDPIPMHLLAVGPYGSTDLRWVCMVPADPEVRLD